MVVQCDVEHARLIDDQHASLSNRSPSQRLRGLALPLVSICGVCIGAFTIHRINLTKTSAENANFEENKFEMDRIKHARFAISQGNVMCEGEPSTDAVAANLEECEARCGDDCGWVVFHALPNTIVPTICKHFATCSTTRPDANGHGRLMRKLPACLPAGRINAQAGMVYRSVKGERVGQPCLVEGINRYYVQAVSRVCLGIPLRGTAGSVALGLHSSQLTCEKACDDDEKCNFYMWKDQPGTVNQYACNLYARCNIFTKPIDGIGAIVFVKPRMLGNYQLVLNNEYCHDNEGKLTELIHEASDQGTLKAASLMHCQSRCDDDPACHFFLYKDDKWAQVHRECITFRSCEKPVPFTQYGHSLVFRKVMPEEHKALQMEPVQTPTPPKLPAAPALVPPPPSPAQPAPVPAPALPAPTPPAPASPNPAPPVPVQPAPLPSIAAPSTPATTAPAPGAPPSPVQPAPVQPAPAPLPQTAAPPTPALPAAEPQVPVQSVTPPPTAAPPTSTLPVLAPPGPVPRATAPLAHVTPKAIQRKCADVTILGTTWCKTSDWDCPRCALAQIQTFSSEATTLTHCALHCLSNSDCEAFNFPKPGDGFCYLKGSGKGCNKDASKNIGNFTCGRLDKTWDYYTLATHRTGINIPQLLMNIAV